MRLYPTTRADKIRFVVLIGLILLAPFVVGLDRVLWYDLSLKQEGDILVQSLPHSELVDVIEGISHAPWSHCGILVRHHGQWEVAEALGSVKYTPLSDWILQGRRFVVKSYRVQHLPADYAAALHRGIEKFLGRAYDIEYGPDDTKIYCSELVYKVYDRELGIKIGHWQKLGELDWKPYEAFVRKMERGNLPLDREMITPVELTRSQEVREVH